MFNRFVHIPPWAKVRVIKILKVFRSIQSPNDLQLAQLKIEKILIEYPGKKEIRSKLALFICRSIWKNKFRMPVSLCANSIYRSGGQRIWNNTEIKKCINDTLCELFPRFVNTRFQGKYFKKGWLCEYMDIMFV
jgi:hypothetical protein